MKENEVFQDLGIKAVEKLRIEEKNIIINNFVNKIINILAKEENSNNMVEYQNKLDKITKKMLCCEIYVAEFENSEKNANYYFKNQTIYLNKQKEYLNISDEYTIHELIHYLQDIREKGQLKRFGLCECLEAKINALGLNEAAVQYITHKMLNKQLEEIKCGNIKLKTKSKNYYPMMCNLIEQIAFLIGDDELIESTIFGNEKFEEKFIDLCGEKVFKDTINVFDKLLELENNDDELENGKYIEKISILYEKAQNIILEGYFYGYFPLIETSKELEDYKEKLINVKELIGDVDNFKFYELLKNNQMEIIKKRILKMNKKFAKKSLIPKKENIVSKIFLRLKLLLYSKK